MLLISLRFLTLTARTRMRSSPNQSFRNISSIATLRVSFANSTSMTFTKFDTTTRKRVTHHMVSAYVS